MKPSEFNRRDFNRLTAAAFGGILTGTTIGCSEAKKGPETKTSGQSTEKSGAAKGDPDKADKKGESVATNDWLSEKHVCRGLNACKNQGASKQNDCAGKGTCATVKAHGCGGENDCKFQGGCGDKPGQNESKEQGSCHVPLMDDAWKKAHASFEAAMKKANKPVGQAPPKKAG